MSVTRTYELVKPYRDVPARLFDRGECSYEGLFDGEIPTYESNIVFTLRFMIDTKVRKLLWTAKYIQDCPKVVGMNWIEVPAGKYRITPGQHKRSTCQLEISVRLVHNFRYFWLLY